MMKKKTEKEPMKVRCAWCGNFERDTEGISRVNGTGEYFMGICLRGVTDGGKKVFADTMRVCDKITKRRTF